MLRWGLAKTEENRSAPLPTAASQNGSATPQLAWQQELVSVLEAARDGDWSRRISVPAQGAEAHITQLLHQVLEKAGAVQSTSGASTEVILERVELMARGDLGAQVQLPPQDELAPVAESINQMVGNLAALVSRVQRACTWPRPPRKSRKRPSSRRRA
jgi:methyl-accepting chemotaxis protein